MKCAKSHFIVTMVNAVVDSPKGPFGQSVTMNEMK